jgi:diguanylate cyclase (GGDEF)-like protein
VKQEKKRLFRRDVAHAQSGASDDAGRAPELELTVTGTPASGKHRNVESMLQEFSSGDVTSARRTPRAGKYDQLWQLSMADPHTGLANQLLLLDRLTQSLARMRRHGGEVVVCHINLDNLGEINTDLGYTIGNTVLCDMADRLTSVLRTEDTIGRVGGNELVVVLAVTDELSVGPLTRRLQKTLDEPVVVGGQPIHLRATLGVALAEEAESAEDVLARADRSTRVGGR